MPMNSVPRRLTASIGSIPVAPVARSQTVALGFAARSAVAGATPPPGRKATVGFAGNAHPRFGEAVATPPAPSAQSTPSKHANRHLTGSVAEHVRQLDDIALEVDDVEVAPREAVVVRPMAEGHHARSEGRALPQHARLLVGIDAPHLAGPVGR